MNASDLIDKINAARTKDELEELGIEHLSVDVDRRKTMDVLRAELSAEARDQAQGEPTQTVIHPEKIKAPGQTGKLGRHRQTGRMMPWTPAMAKMSHMEEV